MIMSVKHRSMWAIWLILFLALIAGLSVGGYFIYEHFKCKPKCKGKKCGDNGCKGNCGTCPSGTTCNSDGTECVQNTWSVSNIQNANIIKSKITTQINGISKDDIDKYIDCIMIAIKKKYSTTKDFIKDTNSIQNLTNIVLSCKPSCNPTCLSNEKCISDQSNSSMCIPNTWTKKFSNEISEKFLNAGAPKSIIDCIMNKLTTTYRNPQDYFSLSNEKGENATNAIVSYCKGPSGSSGPSGPCNVTCSLPGKCFGPDGDQVCVPNNWKSDMNFNKRIENYLRIVLINKIPAITDTNVLVCVMNNIKQNYGNPQDFMPLLLEDTQTLGEIIDRCNNPNPNAPRDGGEQFADTCILNNTPGYGKCMPVTIESCANQMCDSRYKSSQIDRQTCYDDVTSWADNHCTGNPPVNPSPGPKKFAYAYCDRETPGNRKSKCVCKYTDTDPQRPHFSESCDNGCGAGNCERMESYHGIH